MIPLRTTGLFTLSYWSINCWEKSKKQQLEVEPPHSFYVFCPLIWNLHLQNTNTSPLSGNFRKIEIFPRSPLDVNGSLGKQSGPLPRWIEGEVPSLGSNPLSDANRPPLFQVWEGEESNPFLAVQKHSKKAGNLWERKQRIFFHMIQKLEYEFIFQLAKIS